MSVVKILILVTLINIYLCQELPNIDNTILGIDLQYGQPIEYSLRNPVFSLLTYFNNKTIFIDGTEYLVPDQMLILDYQTEQQKSINEVYVSSYMATMSLSESLSYGFQPLYFNYGMFSESEQVSYFNQMFEFEASYMAMSYLRITTMKTSLQNITFADNFKKDVLSLPEYNKQTCKYYKVFFNTYGTHVIFDSIYGGIITMTTSFNMDILETKTIEQVQEEINYQFFLLTSSSSLSYYEEQQLEELNLIYTSSFQIIGGNPSIYNATNNKPWIDSIPNSPLFVGLNTKNFTEIVKLIDNNINIQNFNQALYDYLLSSLINWQFITNVPSNLLYNMKSSNLIVIDNNIYLMSLGYSYNIINNQFSKISGLPLPYFYESPSPNYCTGANDKIYCFGGYYQHPNMYFTTGQAYVYDPLALSWSELRPIPLLNDNYGLPFSFLFYWPDQYINYPVNINDEIYIIGNALVVHDLPDEFAIINFKYNITSNTYVVLDYPNNECWIAATPIVINNLIYMLGGYSTNVNGRLYSCPYESFNSNILNNPTNIMYALDTNNMTWSQLESMPVILEFFSALAINNKIYVIGGINFISREFNEYTYIYDNNSWSSTLTDDKLIGFGSYGKAFNNEFLFSVIDPYNNLGHLSMYSRSIVEFC
ncbi:membrane-attack complex/perforin MACPF family protein [Hokovirus HKV1]|uniref:Membrane-attack complex/perforin MACPF family protein n=1 Tax=Hokovirus HKV1 TaxID=1977638 RepID=A0A1V0SEM7_9VIRU|nr:membrane-attack complex/perforin MACPF family protein [Hokovirus HKV1]